VVADGDVTGLYDGVRITQLFDNLLENAIKYSPSAGTIEVRLRREGDQVHAVVADSGIGIPAADAPHLFERFHRGSNVDDRQFAGMGLGLYICRGIVEQHGGRIWAEARTGGGTEIHAMLPALSKEPVA
jgi:signal transduction histidine kinase